MVDAAQRMNITIAMDIPISDHTNATVMEPSIVVKLGDTALSVTISNLNHTAFVSHIATIGACTADRWVQFNLVIAGIGGHWSVSPNTNNFLASITILPCHSNLDSSVGWFIFVSGFADSIVASVTGPSCQYHTSSYRH